MKKEDNIGYKLRLIHNQIHKRMEYRKSQNGFDCSDLTRMQRFTIGFLNRNTDREIYQKDIETEFSISRATASNMLAVMERKDLIKREAVVHDARLKKIVLTEHARQFLRQVEQDIIKTEELLTNGMSEDDQRQLHRYLDAMIQNLVADIGDDTTICCKKEDK